MDYGFVLPSLNLFFLQLALPLAQGSPGGAVVKNPPAVQEAQEAQETQG